MAAETEFPAPGAAVPGAPPPLRRSAGAVAAPPAADAEAPVPAAPELPAPAGPVAPAAGTSPIFVAAALAGAAVGLWLERVWGR